tara:strand:- start:194 stop:982 length:789 start_codon:yes stop_codon:yes gene_type:complete
MIGIISTILCTLTFGAIWHHMQARASGNESTRIKFIAPWTFAMIAMAIMAGSRLFDDSGLNFYFYNSLFIAAFTICSILYLVSLFRQVEHLGLIVLPVTVVCIVLNMLFLKEGVQVTLSFGIETHIVASIIAFSVLGLAAVQAILLFFQDRTLKSHTNTGLLRALPSLHESETLLFQTISLGVLILTVTLASGFIYLEDIFAQHLVHKTLLSSLAWLVFVVLLWGRMQFGWRGTTAIRWSLSGFTFLILAYFGSKFVLELVL